jgi:ubiquinone/menaquinone biosynthesis C-methylase UbiE
MELGFSGEVADFYAEYRRGYPASVIDSLVDSFGLTRDDLVVDLGCGTGQLALPIADRVRAVVGVDPEADMLARARRAAFDRGVVNATWLVGSDTDLPVLLAGERVAAVTIGQALHWMDHRALFRGLVPLLRPGGGIAVVTNGTPLWLQDSAWSRALRGCLEEWFDTALGGACGTDEASQRRYRAALVDAGYEVSATAVDYADELDLDRIVGGVYSALSADSLPDPERRPEFAERIRLALAPHAPFTEHVRVSLLVGRIA